jgi:hypothetical protein
MTQDEIYEMAHQAGVENEFNYDFRLSLEAFAKLVAAKALAKEKALQALHSENGRLGLYKDAYAQPQQAYLKGFDEGCKSMSAKNKTENIGCLGMPVNVLVTPPQPEQEPVAYYHPHKGFYFAKPTSVSAPTIVDFEPLALYITPPQRTWVGLTDEQIDAIGMKMFGKAGFGGNDDREFARLLEAKFKEKNT